MGKNRGHVAHVAVSRGERGVTSLGSAPPSERRAVAVGGRLGFEGIARPQQRRGEERRGS